MLSKLKAFLLAACFGAGIVTTLPASAFSDIYVTGCVCATTSDFETAAKNQSISNFRNDGGLYTGTFVVISNIKARTAWVDVTGKITIINQEPHWTITSSVPVDSNDVSIANESETTLEQFYNTVDQVVTMTDRNSSEFYDDPSLPNFTTTDDVTIGLAFYDNNQNGAWNIPDESIITLYFKDGTMAVYEVLWLGTGPTAGAHIRQNFTLNFLRARNPKGDPIDHAGHILGTVPTGGNGGGSTNVNNFPPTGGRGVINYGYSGSNYCTSTETITWGTVSITTEYLSPC